LPIFFFSAIGISSNAATKLFPYPCVGDEILECKPGGIVYFFQYPQKIRRMIYTTNAVEALYRQFRKVAKVKPIFPNDEALTKMLVPACPGYGLSPRRERQRCKLSTVIR